MCRFSIMAMIAMLFSQCVLFSQEAKKEFDDMSLEEMLDVKVTVASKTSMTQRESPGIVTVVTHQEIINSGARDLIDILNMVPGFALASDVQNTVGIGVRGSWAHEGKVLLLVDGQEFNETIYSTLQLGNHLPLEEISRIEIIRGPGSATYGGYAELGVINIITKSAAEVNGIQAAASYGQMARSFARRTISISFGKQINGLDIVAHTFLGQGNRSDRDYTDAYGNSFSMKGNSDLNPMNVNVGVGYKGLSTRFIMDRFSSSTRDIYDESIDQVLPNDFNSYYVEAGYNYAAGKKITVTPKFNYKHQAPWNCITESCRENGFYFGKTSERFEESLAISYVPSKIFNLLAGGDFYYDRAQTPSDAPENDLFVEGSHKFSYNNAAFFGQGLFHTVLADITVGARVERHSLAGNSFAPRFGLTKVKGKFHIKGLISRAFRAPSIANIVLNSEIKPERTTVMEFEAGYQITRNSYLTGNLFNSRIKQPIVYSYNNEEDVETYANFSETGTRGFEMDYRFKEDWGYINANYSFYRAVDNKVDFYTVDDNPGVLLGFPAHKISTTANIRLVKNLALNPSLVYLSRRYGYTTIPEEGDPKKFDQVYLVNINLNWRNIASPGVDLDLSVYDIFGQDLQFIQPYKGGHAPLPGPSREFRIRLGYRWNFPGKL